MSHYVNRRFKLRPISAALLAALATPAAVTVYAEDSASKDSAPTVTQASTPNSSISTEQTLPEVQVRGMGEANDYNAGVTSIGGKVPTAIRDIPQSVTVINRAVLDAQGATTLKEALRNVPGITISAGEGGVIGDNINIRGYSARTDLFLDGFRDRGQYSRETFFLESVEVLKGPSSMLFGRGSTGGVINQVSKQANLRDSAELSQSLGTENYYRTTADVNQKLSDTSAVRVSALAHTNESTRDIIENNRNGVASSLRFGIDTPTEVGISLVHQHSAEIPDYGVPVMTGTVDDPGKPLDVDHGNFYGYTDDHFNQNVNIAALRIEHKFSPTLSLRNQTQYSTANVDAAPTRLEATLVRNRLERNIEDTSLFNQTDVIVKLDTGSIKHTFTTGMEIGRDDYQNQGFNWTGETPVADPDHPVYEPMPASATRDKSTFTDNASESLAFYVNDTIELNAQWKLIAGVRWDRFSIDSDVLNNVTLVTTKFDRTDRMTSYRAGVLYQPDVTQSYYLSYGTSFNPSAETLTLSAANSTVDPEENRSVEVGGKWDLLNGALSLTSAVFRVEKTNARETVLGVVELAGDQRVDGFEIGATGKITSTWQVFAGYTHLEGEVVKSVATPENEGNVLNNTPEHTASLWSTALFSGGTWEVGGGLVYSSERLLNNANTAVIDGYTRWDATFAYHQKKYDLRLNLHNLTDEGYFEVASGGRATPAQGRSMLGTLTYRF